MKTDLSKYREPISDVEIRLDMLSIECNYLKDRYRKLEDRTTNNYWQLFGVMIVINLFLFALMIIGFLG